MTLTDRILAAGVENIVFLVTMRPIRTMLFINYKSSVDKAVLVPALISEGRYRVVDNYKITLTSMLPGFGKEDYYICDLEELIKNGHIQFFIRDNLTGECQAEWEIGYVTGGDIGQPISLLGRDFFPLHSSAQQVTDVLMERFWPANMPTDDYLPVVRKVAA